MKPIGVLTDSHSGLTKERGEELGVRVLSMPFYIEEECYYENVTLSREEFFARMRNGANVSTSQPSPAEVMKFWDEALKEYEKVIYIPISSGLSGSCATAMALAQDDPYEGRVFVVDNGRVSVPLLRSVLDALELIEEGYSAEQIKEILEEARARMIIYVGVETLENLKRGGRITPAAASLGTLLNIKPVLKFDVGNLDTYKKCRGFEKAKQAMIDAIKHDFENEFKEEYVRGEVYLLAASSADEETTAAWKKQIEEAFPGMEVLCDNLPLAISCHIGEGGLGIACSCRPKRV